MYLEKYEIELKHTLDIELMMCLGNTYEDAFFEHQTFSDFINVILTEGIRSYNKKEDKNE